MTETEGLYWLRASLRDRHTAVTALYSLDIVSFPTRESLTETKYIVFILYIDLALIISAYWVMVSVRIRDKVSSHASSSRIITGCISKNRLPSWSWLAATARTPAPFMDPADLWRYTLQHSCWMVQGSSSWPFWVDATNLCCLRDLMMMMMMMMLALTLGL